MNYCKICGRPAKGNSHFCGREQCRRINTLLERKGYYNEDIRWWLWVEEHTLKDFLEDKKKYYILNRMKDFYQSFVRAWEQGNLPYLTPKEHRVYAVLKVKEMFTLDRYPEDLKNAVLEKFAVILHTEEEKERIYAKSV